MNIGDIMQRQIVTIGQSVDLETAAQTLRARGTDCLVVVDLRGRTVGLLTQQDIDARPAVVQLSADADGSGVVQEEGRHLETVAQAMRTTLPAVGENDALLEAVGKMAEYGVRHLPVLRGSKAVGLVGPAELRMAARLAEQPVAN